MVTTTEDTRGRIIDAAERLMQLRGYNGFSYRDIAAEVGIRSPSIHHHFPTKADLGVAVARRYTERFQERLRQAQADGADARRTLEVLVSLFREVLAREGRMCLCGILGAELPSLPDEVAAEARRFFEVNTDWLARLLRDAVRDGLVDLVAPPELEARLLFATLEGAMIRAKTEDTIGSFDEVAAAALQRLRWREA
ncbi:MAG: TetR/AcrR family transcriptional regulator [Alphaproteobacteria bacterium]|nr:TetR/AcrR family transcriptional regulator [Alphaproteobacteria bacterium]